MQVSERSQLMPPHANYANNLSCSCARVDDHLLYPHSIWRASFAGKDRGGKKSHIFICMNLDSPDSHVANTFDTIKHNVFHCCLISLSPSFAANVKVCVGLYGCRFSLESV